jgi:hypothetical protein
MPLMAILHGSAFRLAVFLLAAVGGPLRAHAGEPSPSFGAVYGYGDRANVYAVQVDWLPTIGSDLLERYDLDLRFVGQVARWLARADQVEHGSLNDGSILAELRYWWPRPMASTRPFVEAGLGLHLLSHVQIATRDLGTAFTFGTEVATGFTFGENGHYELAALISHVSNGMIRQPNDGFTYGGIRFRVALPP